ncbi:hypothetical protein [Saccharothrix coeruleofusca]|uniref:Uncharacterized protein n=1 Tax=Saccharothrix coeruleofusca TaxID=33919 RepID=A0A918AVB8_9PSEU|nr:hypothetical protein [Saccharothrix coeruleofusca]GGP80315.1 hypothetical protein GCM10010185_62690 [Saccharothrix coeruleofusca]
MPYHTITPQDLVDGLVRWVRAEHPVISVVSTRTGGWQGWAAAQFTYWLGASLGDPADLDVESGVTATAVGGTAVFDNPARTADLVFNALSAPADGVPPVIVVALRCQRVRQTQSRFRACLTQDLTKLGGISDELRRRYRDRGVVGLSLGVCFATTPAPEGHHVVAAGDELAVQWRSTP